MLFEAYYAKNYASILYQCLLAAALKKTTDELALVQLNAVHVSMRSFLERFLKKCVEVLVNSDRVSERDKTLLKSNSMSAINGVVERHWSLFAAALFPEFYLLMLVRTQVSRP